MPQIDRSTTQRVTSWDLYPITDLALSGHQDYPSLIDALIAGGVRVIQLRMKGASTEEIAATARVALPRCRAAGVDLIINDDAEACRSSGADGLHVGQGDLPPREARRIIGPDKILGLSTHGREQFTAALGEPVDYIAVGPIFGTRSKENPDPMVGLELVRWARSQTDRPLVAIGGITEETLPSVLEAGAEIVAVIAAVMGAGDVTEAVRRLRETWR
jgi:thiamine-phosphate pyrophosphorylase